MYLKSIEIQGFKSFAKKITLNFKNGITGIVGPNGSGKSNVADALRWVLGEQRIKQLRGSKMEDVIFSGTANRNPLSFAYVAITFDNSDRQLGVDFTDVVIARKLYRSGESEYLLNGSVCRLKDIRELFYDTGIGKEGYSIIGQGQIDKILQGKSEERRELFDEACGIVKYKKRKTIALRKLENERLNLERIKDITGELSRRIGPLKRQSETANKFIEYKNELKSLDINLFLFENGDLRSRIKECESKEASAARELEESKEELSRMKSEHEKANADLMKLDSDISDLRTRISQGEIVKESLSGQINVLNEQINSAKESQGHFAQRQREILASIKEGEAEKSSLEEEQALNKKALDEALKLQNQQSESLISLRNRAFTISEEIESLKEKHIENLRRRGEISARIERLKATVEQIEKRKSELEETVKKYLENKEKQEEKVKELLEQFRLQEEKVKTSEQTLAAKKNEVATLERESELLSRDLSAVRLDVTKAETRLESVRNITERYEGYTNAIKEVMNLKAKKPGIIGVVADIIKVEKRYETAIETALGGSIQNIVTDNENTAKEAIEYLKVNKLGRATFLPLKAVKGRGEFRNTEVLDERGVLGPANSLVTVEDRYKDLAEYLLGRIVVADTIDNALVIARKYRYSLIIVTLDGELLSRGGALSGGAYKNKSNLLGRRREIDELEKAIEDYKKKGIQISDSLAKNSEMRRLGEDEVGTLATALQEEKIYLNTIEVNLSQAKALQNELKGSFESADMENKKALEEADNITEENERLSGTLAENEAENEAVREKIIELEEALKEQRTLEEEADLKSRNTDIERSRLSEQQSFIVNSIIKAENNISRLQAELENLRLGNENSEGGVNEKLAEIEEINASLKRAEVEQEKLNNELERLELTRKSAQGENGDFLRKHDEISERISDLDKEVFRLGQMKEKYEEQSASKSDYIWEEYELTYNSALEYKDESLTDISQMRSRIGEIKNSIRSLGTINVSAIEEYKEIKERFEFLSAQQEDIQKAEEDIVKIIKNLDKEMRRQFKTEFGRIAEEFERVFKIMFGGGHGSIELEDDENLLDSDIAIIAQPPGKKLQNMMQLSGGEKALTAIAVLFAIQNLKPSPFCILDEIEAALDDSNISRFSNYLMLLSGKIQFIVITHRKGTMEACDRLYGITMQEKGVSSLVSVNLEDVEKDM